MPKIMVEVSVKFPIDESVNDSQIKDYVREAVQYWGGQFPKHDPFFALMRQRVTAGKVARSRPRKSKDWNSD